MKKYLTFLILAACSCDNQDTFCFECTTFEKGTPNTITRCDITESDARKIEQAGTTIKTYEQFPNPYYVVSERRTVCSKRKN